MDDAADTIRDAVGETFLFARLDSHSMDLDDTIDEIKGVLNGTVDATDDIVDDTDDFEHPFIESRKRFGNKFVKESSGSKWFNEWGWLNKRIPKACIEDCSGLGRKDEAVAYWVKKLQFNIPRNLMKKAKDYLKEFGAWDDMDIDFWAEADAIDHELSKHVLWCFCCDVADGNLSQDELYLGH